METLNIAFIADGGFFLPSVVALTSLLDNMKTDSRYHIYFIVVDFSDKQKNVLTELSKKHNVPIDIIEIKESELQNKYSGIAKHDCCASISALIKFDLPYICGDIDRLLYLDGDIIVQTDLSELNHIRFEGTDYAAVVEDSGVLYSQTLIRQNINHYFNSGVMLLNLKALRSDKIPEKLVEEKFRDQDNSLMDQHVLNKVFTGHIKILPVKYNLLYMNLIRAHYFYSLSIQDINDKYSENFRDWDEMRDKASIIHYSSFDKPWKYSDVSGVEIWDSYYQKSPFMNQPLKRKKLFIPLLNKMRQKKGLSLIASFIWECETKGISLALKDTFKFIFKKNR
ncbi:MAG: glycosyltransferase family 8 protein [Lachnospiraceae bacterium]|nr:glycosyltransferase family 8 protein [Lachnospiraceae bacterium]